jgi:hypothetical protein
MRGANAVGIVIVGCAIVAWLPAVAPATPAGGGLFAREQPDPFVVAQGHVKQARD